MFINFPVIPNEGIKLNSLAFSLRIDLHEESVSDANTSIC